jgi:hypothetical protein
VPTTQIHFYSLPPFFHYPRNFLCHSSYHPIGVGFNYKLFPLCLCQCVNMLNKHLNSNNTQSQSGVPHNEETWKKSFYQDSRGKIIHFQPTNIKRIVIFLLSRRLLMFPLEKQHKVTMEICTHSRSDFQTWLMLNGH